MINDFAVYEDTCDNWVVIARIGGLPVYGILIPKTSELSLSEALMLLEDDNLPLDIAKMGAADATRFSIRNDNVKIADITPYSIQEFGDCEYVRAYTSSL